MKQFYSGLTVMLVACSAAGLAQTAPPPAAKPPVASQPAEAAPAAAAAQAVPVSPSAGNTGGPIDPERYVIGAEDSLQITVWKEPTLSGTIPVRPDGMISLVLVGDLRAAGQTPMALSADISQRLKKYIQDPVVTRCRARGKQPAVLYRGRGE